MIQIDRILLDDADKVTDDARFLLTEMFGG